MPTPDKNQLHHDITAEISRGEVSRNTCKKTTTPSAFDALALRLFNVQYENNTAYRNYCKLLNQSPDSVRSWQAIPPVPTDAFKQHDHPLVFSPTAPIQQSFHTSGTTGEVKGHHHFPSTDLYEHSIIQAWQHANLPQPHHAIVLTPTAASAPHSSLSFMMHVLTDHGSDHSEWLIEPNGTISDSAIQTLSELADCGKPIAFLGTALAFLQLFDQLPTPLKLPNESWAMETGGYKGSQRSLEKEELYTLFESKLHLAPDSIINEYSMTELSSQFYTQGLGNPHHGPPWTRIRVINPATGAEASIGEPGYLIIYDLANFYSVMAIQTQDIAIAHDERSFTLLGRDPSALPRGCSRSVTPPTHQPA